MVVASSYMHDLGRHLAPWFRVFIPDLPGFGRSSQAIRRGDPVSIGQLAQGLHDWIDAAGVQKAHFVSNSLGCQVLAEFTRRWPDRIGRPACASGSDDGYQSPTVIQDSACDGCEWSQRAAFDEWHHDPGLLARWIAEGVRLDQRDR